MKKMLENAMVSGRDKPKDPQERENEEIVECSECHSELEYGAWNIGTKHVPIYLCLDCLMNAIYEPTATWKNTIVERIEDEWYEAI